ncbi:hypothetical protein GCM10020229_08160 [Kitasatospora albolonga]|uniref:hypothetical protein n=1 Tax=Kitasatospora albolonga TaxID=68173 RepID=UPI0031E50B67
MAVETVIGLVGIVVLTACVVGIVLVWRTGSPIYLPPYEAPRPPCRNCGHSAHTGGCDHEEGSGDRYENGDWVGFWNYTHCRCSEYVPGEWPPPRAKRRWW